jgi:pantothenate kinase
VTPTLDELAERLQALPGRAMIGIAGAPGAGKSTLAAALAERVGGVVVPMDGFHRSNEDLAAEGRLDRKGEPASFDRVGFAALLARIRSGEPVHAPLFDREHERTAPDALEVPPDRPVITEGNYLLLWPEVAATLDEVWFLEPDEPTRLERLIARHVLHGRTPEQARQRAATGSDADNARLVRPTRVDATLIIET